MTDPQIQLLDSTVAESEDVELNSWLDRLKHAINTIVIQVRRWMDTHTTVNPPLYLENPHEQYWHKILDPAWGTMHFQDFTTPKTVTNGQIVTNWTENVIGDWQVVTDLVNGTITFDSSGVLSELGYYYLSISVFLEGAQNTSYALSVYMNGAVTGIRIPVILKGNATASNGSWSGVIGVTVNAVLDIRLEIGASVDISSISWSVHRISPSSTTGLSGTFNNGGLPDASPIPPDWGQPP